MKPEVCRAVRLHRSVAHDAYRLGVAVDHDLDPRTIARLVREHQESSEALRSLLSALHEHDRLAYETAVGREPERCDSVPPLAFGVGPDD